MKQLFKWSEQTWLYLDQVGILTGNILMLITVLGGIVSFFKREQIRRWFRRNRFPGIGGQNLEKDWGGLVFSFSRIELAEWVIDEIQPLWVGLLLTEQTQKHGLDLKARLKTKNIQVETRLIDQPDSPEQAFKQTKSLLNSPALDKTVGEVAVDITGGKVPMSLGAFMAAEESGVDSIYITSEYRDGKPDMSTAKIISISNNENTS